MRFAVKEWREKIGMSQEELAQKSGISRQTISAIENGACDSVKTGTLLSIANALDTTADQLYFFADSVKC